MHTLNSKTGWIDTHIHLSAPEYSEDLKELIARDKASNVSASVAIGSGYGLAGIHLTLEISNQYKNIFPTVGIHPNEASEQWNFSQIEELAKNPAVIAIGETGLDYYRNDSQREDQLTYFQSQIELAKKLKKPLIIHNREAGSDCLKILKQFHAEEVGGVFHCYSEDASFAQELDKINFKISITGNITYKNNAALREAISKIPLTQIMLETDGPYLSPQSKRGKRNESSFLVETATTIANIKQISLAELAEITSNNAKQLFKIDF